MIKLGERTFHGNLTNGQQFVMEVALKDSKGMHAGYGPGKIIHRRGDSAAPVLLGYNRVYPVLSK